MRRRVCSRRRFWSVIALGEWRIIQQNNDRASEMPRQLTQKPLDPLPPDVVKKEEIVEAR